MLKNILKLKGAQQLTKKEQKNINGSGVWGNCDRYHPQPICQVDYYVMCIGGEWKCAYT
ncbi:hypothetical protein [Flavobacterium aestivum]|jgi:hypothetical protein|uniref:hypothetical protein n=1 Tax=Flavobacterium aestivum TaxID=3003257 RepID=UPI002286A40A|nr:hypothetical protein [Flavobacterium aestivum]